MDVKTEIGSSAERLAAVVREQGQLRGVLDQLLPVLVDGFADLLAQPHPVSDPLLHLAMYLMRHNPGHVANSRRSGEPTTYMDLYNASLKEAMERGPLSV